MADVCVLGLGYVGLPTAVLFAQAGLRVLGVDRDPEVLHALRAGRPRNQEAELEERLAAAVQSGHLTFAATPEASGAYIICVPTALRPDKNVDLSAVEAAARAIGPLLPPGALVILESTSPVGTTRGVLGRLLSESGWQPGRDFDLCYCPERVRPGKTWQELIHNERLAGGWNACAAERARALYARFCRGRITLTDDRTAEFCKLLENAYRDVNIAFANSAARMAEAAGLDAWQAIAWANRHPRVNILRPGPGAGGHCIPVDPWFLASAFPGAGGLLRAARVINDEQPGRLWKRLQAAGSIGRGEKLAILGVAYKEDIDDARESPALRLARHAAAAGVEAALHDPLLAAAELEGHTFTRDLPACLENAAAAVLVTGHGAYRKLDPGVFAQNMKGRLIADARNVLDHERFRQAGFTVLVTGIGSPSAPKE